MGKNQEEEEKVENGEQGEGMMMKGGRGHRLRCLWKNGGNAE